MLEATIALEKIPIDTLPHGIALACGSLVLLVRPGVIHFKWSLPVFTARQ